MKDVTRRKAMEYLKINRSAFKFERFIDLFDSSYIDFIAYVGGKEYKFKVFYSISEIRDFFIDLQLPKDKVVSTIFEGERRIETVDGTIKLGNKFVWYGKKFVNVYDFSKIDGIVYFESDNEKWEKIARSKFMCIRLDYGSVFKTRLPNVDYKSISTFINFLVRGNFYWETRFIRDKVISDRFHKNKFEIFEHLSRFRLDEANFYIGINPRSEMDKKKKSVQFGNVIYVDFDSERAKYDFDYLLKAFINNGIEPSLAGVSGRGAHFYWKLRDVIPADKWEKLQKRFVDWVHANFSDYEPDRLIDRTRISRILGTYNQKSDAESKVLHLSEKTYDAEHIAKFKKGLSFKLI